ncbi:unnamed protein product [Phyllotreta striolata]|uniref:TM2 domain-containing protein n=1 Tax=Phyllotreta striolata TaxID=444603 RepID=A0A9N9U0V9_PHYSR|nr:unnamed protein product [Phyllotreta striolata]
MWTDLLCLLLSAPLVLSLNESGIMTNCNNLRMGQYLCPDPDYLRDMIDEKTQEIKGCTKDNLAKIRCIAVEGFICNETGNNTFYKDTPCKWTNGYSFETTLLLSIFLGMFGVDRFYLGYPAIGLLKFCTLGFMFLGQLIDVILISMQVVTPKDGSHYVMPHYGPRIEIIKSDNFTYRLSPGDW